MHTHIYTHIYTYTRICTYTHIYTYAYTHTHIHIEKERKAFPMKGLRSKLQRMNTARQRCRDQGGKGLWGILSAG